MIRFDRFGRRAFPLSVLQENAKQPDLEFAQHELPLAFGFGERGEAFDRLPRQRARASSSRSSASRRCRVTASSMARAMTTLSSRSTSGSEKNHGRLPLAGAAPRRRGSRSIAPASLPGAEGDPHRGSAIVLLALSGLGEELAIHQSADRGLEVVLAAEARFE